MGAGTGKPYQYVFLGAVQGAGAWCAYAVTEFVFCSLLSAVVRRYAAFTSWHWQLTAELVLAYVVAGALAGAAAGAAVYLFASKDLIHNRDRGSVLEHAGTFTLAVAFAANVLLNPLTITGKNVVFLVAVAFTVLLAAAIRSERWNERAGFLTNAWVVSGFLLGLGQAFALLQMEDVARTLGARFFLWGAVLVALLAVVVAGSILLGRRLRPRLARDRLTLLAPGWAALGLAAVLILGGQWLGRPPAAVQASVPVKGRSGAPNVLMIVLDTVRADHLSLYGYGRETTPNLKKLAQDSTVFSNAISASDMTLASHASLFTGMYASWHGAHCQPPDATYGRALDADVPTLAEMLSRKGYSTLGVSANLYLRAEFGLQRGFQIFEIPRPLALLPSESYWYLLRTGLRRVLSSFEDTSQFDRLYTRSEDVNRTLFAAASRENFGGTPFFIFLNYMDAHFPYIPPAPYEGMFPGSDHRMMQEDMEETSSRVVRGQPMPAAEHAHRIAQYDAGIAYMDHYVGRVVDWLKQEKLYDNSMIVVTSDHGEGFGAKRLVLHGNSVYQDLLHVALMVKYPHQEEPAVQNAPVSLIDVVPTVLDTLGMPVPKNVQGRDLHESGSERKRELFSESFPCPVVHPPECANGCVQRAVFSWPDKFIVSSSGRREEYNLASDPQETSNRYGVTNEASARLAAELEGWVKTIPVKAAQRSKIDSESVRRLKSLGYVQ